jgi:hypothetical protein
MCDGAGSPTRVSEALAMLDRALDYLNAADAASLPSTVQAEALRALGRAEAKHTAARARVLAGFAAQGGFEEDGHGTARSWLRWQTQVTAAAAAGAVGWARRLAAHPVIGRALAAGELSPSWARQVCEWTGRLPEDRRGDADQILAAAARGGASLAGLGLALEMYVRCCSEGGPGPEDDGFEDRWFRLGITFRGAGRAEGDLTAGCAAALGAVLAALGKKAGPEDVRTGAQRRHDALEEACQRLIRAGMVPGRAGQPTQVLVHMTLGQLRGLPGASAAEGAWAAARACQPGWVTGPDAEAAACDATMVPVVTGHVDEAALDTLTDIFLAATTTPAAGSGPVGGNRPAGPGPAVPDAGPGGSASASPDVGPGLAPVPPRMATGPGAATRPGTASRSPAGPGSPAAAEGGTAGPGGAARDGCGCTCGGCACLPPQPPRPGPMPLTPATRDRLRRALLGLAADALSGPGGLTARLRAALDGKPLTTVSLPLDIGAATGTIPAHLRRAATTRHPHCAFPGCAQPASARDIHHIVPRSRGGPTALANLVPLCGFHHLIAVHRQGWDLRLNPDGTTTATSPDRTRTLHGHGPPRQAA